METTKQNEYRVDIDGMRAIAVIAVLVFHAFPRALPGGFLGVDIFFVISGFLITGIISRGVDTGKFSMMTFYQKRIRRIYPALLTVLIFTLVAGFIILPPTQMHELGWHLMGAAFFIPNLLLWGEAGYFDVNSSTKPLLHLWSLGVEEQFYIFWPILLWAVSRLRWRRPRVMAFIIAASLAYNIYLGVHSPTAAFYSPLSRAWELASGGFLACLAPIARSDRAKTRIAVIGICLVLAAMVFATEATFSAFYAAIAVVGAGLMISAGPENGLARSVLSTKPFVAIGLISYPLYLWHWPILVFARIEHDHLMHFITLVLSAVSVALAAYTYLRIERPLQERNLTTVSIFLLVALVALGSFGTMTSRLDIRSLAYPPKMREILAYSHYYFRTPEVGLCWLYEKGQRYSSECDFDAGAPHPRVAIWGDSHAGRLEPGFSLAVQDKASVKLFAADSCPPIRGFKECSQYTTQALAAIVSNKPDIVILFARWSVYSKSYAAGPEANGLNDYINELERAGIKIAIVGPFPDYPGQLPNVIYDQWVADRSLGIPTRVPNMPGLATTSTDSDLRALAKRRNLAYLSLKDLFCKNGTCATSWSDNPSDLLSWDYGHLTTDGAKFVSKALLDVLAGHRLLVSEKFDSQSDHCSGPAKLDCP